MSGITPIKATTKLLSSGHILTNLLYYGDGDWTCSLAWAHFGKVNEDEGKNIRAQNSKNKRKKKKPKNDIRRPATTRAGDSAFAALSVSYLFLFFTRRSFAVCSNKWCRLVVYALSKRLDGSLSLAGCGFLSRDVFLWELILSGPRALSSGGWSRAARLGADEEWKMASRLSTLSSM